jgi:hypothetical protein
MATVSILFCCYLLTGVAIVATCDVIFAKDGFNKLCFSPGESALLALAWPYYICRALWERD